MRVAPDGLWITSAIVAGHVTRLQTTTARRLRSQHQLHPNSTGWPALDRTQRANVRGSPPRTFARPYATQSRESTRSCGKSPGGYTFVGTATGETLGPCGTTIHNAR